ncbi:MAG: response regulator [Bradymonadaceae bacterium]
MSEGERLFLIVEPDASTHRALESALTERGDRVLIRESADQALEVLCSEPIDLVIASTTLADGDGFRLCSLLRDQTDFDAIPLLFISDDSSKSRRLEGLQSGAGDYVTKPFFFAELEQRIDALLSHARQIGAEASWEVSEGSLADRSLVDILTEVEDDELTGILSVERDGRQAVVHFESGDIIGAVSGTLEGKEAVLGLVAWPSGEYVLRSIERDEVFEHAPDELVLVSIAPLEPWNEVVEGLPNIQRCFARTGDSPPDIEGFDAEAVEGNWRLFDGERTIGDVISESSPDLVVTLRILDLLLADEHLEDVTDRDEISGPGTGEPKPDFARWIDPVGWSAAAVEAGEESNGFEVVPPIAETGDDGSTDEQPSDTEPDADGETATNETDDAAASGADEQADTAETDEASDDDVSDEPLETAAEDGESETQTETEQSASAETEPADGDDGETEEQETEETTETDEVSADDGLEETTDEVSADEDAGESADEVSASEEDGDDRESSEETSAEDNQGTVEFDDLPETLDKPFEEVGEGEVPGEVKDYDPDEAGMQPFARHRPGTIEHVCLTLDDAPGASGTSADASHEEPPSERIEPITTPDADDAPDGGGMPGPGAGGEGGDEESERETPVSGVETAAGADDEEDGDSKEGASDGGRPTPEPDESSPRVKEQESPESAGTGPIVAIVLVVGIAVAGVFLFGGGGDEPDEHENPDPDPSVQASSDDEETIERPEPTPEPEETPTPSTSPDEQPDDSPDLQVVRDTRKSGEAVAGVVASKATDTATHTPGAQGDSSGDGETTADDAGTGAGSGEESEASGVRANETPDRADADPASSAESGGGAADDAAESGDGAASDAAESTGQRETAEKSSDEPAESEKQDEAVADESNSSTDEPDESDESEDDGGDGSSGSSGSEKVAAISDMISRGEFASAERKLDALPDRLLKDEKVRDLYLNLAAGYQTEADDVAAAKRIYNKYLNLFPDGKYASQVRSILVRLNSE